MVVYSSRVRNLFCSRHVQNHDATQTCLMKFYFEQVMESIHLYIYMYHMLYEYAQNNILHVLFQLDPCACQCAQVSPINLIFRCRSPLGWSLCFVVLPVDHISWGLSELHLSPLLSGNFDLVDFHNPFTDVGSVARRLASNTDGRSSGRAGAGHELGRGGFDSASHPVERTHAQFR